MGAMDELDAKLQIAGWRRVPGPDDRLCYRLHRSVWAKGIGWAVVGSGALFALMGFALLGDPLSGVGDAVLIWILASLLLSIGVAGTLLEMDVDFDRTTRTVTSTWCLLGRRWSSRRAWSDYEVVVIQRVEERGPRGGAFSKHALWLVKPDGRADALFSVKSETDARRVGDEIAAFTGLGVKTGDL